MKALGVGVLFSFAVFFSLSFDPVYHLLTSVIRSVSFSTLFYARLGYLGLA